MNQVSLFKKIRKITILIFSLKGEKPHACPECGKKFSSTSNLKTHLRLHSGSKPYKCDKCKACFTQFVHLKLHHRLHNNERPFTCSGCGKSYISASGLRTHWKTGLTCKPSAADLEINAERAAAEARMMGSPGSDG